MTSSHVEIDPEILNQNQINGIKDIIEKIKNLGFVESAKRLHYLVDLSEDEFEDGEDRLHKKAVVGFYNYLIQGKYFDEEPRLVLPPSGRLGATWTLKESNNRVVIEFIDEQSANWGIVFKDSSSHTRKGGKKSSFPEINKIFLENNLCKS